MTENGSSGTPQEDDLPGGDEQVAEAGDAGSRRASRQRRKATHAKPRRRRRLKWALGILGLVIVLVVGAVAGDAWYLNHKIHRVVVKGLRQAPTKGIDVGTENILMVGSTSRCALAVQSKAFGLCSQGVTGVNSDVVMILHVDQSTHSVSILSIPRDLFVPNARKEGAYKIDAALYEGPTQLVDAVEEDFGIPIQHYVELNFDSFINVVNALGGVKMYFPEEVFDAYSGLDIRTTGCIDLNGTQALQVVRARHLQYKGPGVTSDAADTWPQEALSDLARIRRDHEFLRVLAAAVKARGLGDPLTDQDVVSSVVGQLEVDSGFSATDMLDLVLTFHSVDVADVPELTLPVSADQAGSYYYKGSDYGDVEFTAEPQDHQAIDQFLGLAANDDTFSGGALPPPSSVTVSVMNGSGVYSEGADTADSLQALGFHVGTVDTTTPVGRQAETVVAYSAVSASELAAAQSVADSLSGAVILAYDPSQVPAGSQVSVVTGTDVTVHPPAAPPASPTSSTASSTAAPSTTTTAPIGSAALAPPNPTVQALQPWDPRACTASGGEGS